MMRFTLYISSLLMAMFVTLACQSAKYIQIDTSEVDTPPDKYGYIEKYNEWAVHEMHRTGIPASITLAQGILESKFGQSVLAKKGNNHFGIKCNEDWEGPRIYKDDDNINDCFRKYRTAKHSFRDHSDYLTSRSRYKDLFDLPQTAYKRWARGLKKAGYATNPKYDRLLINIIEKYELYKYDRLKPSRSVAKKKKKDEEQEKTDKQPQKQKSEVNPVYEYNRIRTIITKKGDTPLKYAQKYNIRLERLLEYNDLSESKVLKEGQKFYLQPKRRSNPVTDYHFVQQGETMEDVSRKYGIQLDLLYKRNLLEPPAQPPVGTKLYLNHPRTNPVTAENQRKSKKDHKDSNHSPSNQHHYTVKQGDTLYSIAEKFRVTVDHLKEVNDITSHNIKPGQKLVIKKSN